MPSDSPALERSGTIRPALHREPPKVTQAQPPSKQQAGIVHTIALTTEGEQWPRAYLHTGTVQGTGTVGNRGATEGYSP